MQTIKVQTSANLNEVKNIQCQGNMIVVRDATLGDQFTFTTDNGETQVVGIGDFARFDQPYKSLQVSSNAQADLLTLTYGNGDFWAVSLIKIANMVTPIVSSIPFTKIRGLFALVGLPDGTGGYTPEVVGTIDSISALSSNSIKDAAFDIPSNTIQQINFDALPGSTVFEDIPYCLVSVDTNFGNWTGTLSVRGIVNGASALVSPIVKNIAGATIANSDILAATATVASYYVCTAGLIGLSFNYQPTLPGDPDIAVRCMKSRSGNFPAKFF